jgi:hypothetical protein
VPDCSALSPRPLPAPAPQAADPLTRVLAQLAASDDPLVSEWGAALAERGECIDAVLVSAGDGAVAAQEPANTASPIKT